MLYEVAELTKYAFSWAFTIFAWFNTIIMKIFFLSLLRKVYLALLTGLATSCAGPDQPPKEFQAATVSEEVLIEQLAGGLYANPKSQPEIDQNAIINYAIDNGLGVQRSSSGMYYLILHKGTGAQPGFDSQITVHYRGSLLNGQVFDSSYDRGTPLNFSLHQVVKGWQEGLPLLRPGGKAILLVPSHLGYGTKGFGNLIPPNTVLRFDIELLKSE